jgi:hypothetical protein
MIRQIPRGLEARFQMEDDVKASAMASAGEEYNNLPSREPQSEPHPVAPERYTLLEGEIASIIAANGDIYRAARRVLKINRIAEALQLLATNEALIELEKSGAGRYRPDSSDAR